MRVKVCLVSRGDQGVIGHVQALTRLVANRIGAQDWHVKRILEPERKGPPCTFVGQLAEGEGRAYQPVDDVSFVIMPDRC